jgi:hypothetical protein
MIIPESLCPAMDTVTAEANLNENAHPYVSALNAWISISDGPENCELGFNTFCTAGTGVGAFASICAFTCALGFCPNEACSCTTFGASIATLPTAANVIACATEAVLEATPQFGPLCSFACNYGYCPSAYCIGDTDTCLAQVDPGDPVPNETDDDRLARLNTMYPGIFWDWAMPGGAGGCTVAQLNILEEATRVGGLMTTYSPQDFDDGAFNRYFVTDGRVSGRWSSGNNRPHWLNLISESHCILLCTSGH